MTRKLPNFAASHQQVCESTGAPYISRPVIGYYECLHTVGN